MIREARGIMANIFHAILSSAVAVALRVAVSDVGEERPPVSFESSLDVTLPKKEPVSSLEHDRTEQSQI